MGMGNSGGSYTPTAAEAVTPAVARSVDTDTSTLASDQAKRRAQLKGVRSTYNSASAVSTTGTGTNGSASKLGA